MINSFNVGKSQNTSITLLECCCIFKNTVHFLLNSNNLYLIEINEVYSSALNHVLKFIIYFFFKEHLTFHLSSINPPLMSSHSQCELFLDTYHHRSLHTYSYTHTLALLFCLLAEGKSNNIA